MDALIAVIIVLSLICVASTVGFVKAMRDADYYHNGWMECFERRKELLNRELGDIKLLLDKSNKECDRLTAIVKRQSTALLRIRGVLNANDAQDRPPLNVRDGFVTRTDCN